MAGEEVDSFAEPQAGGSRPLVATLLVEIELELRKSIGFNVSERDKGNAYKVLGGARVRLLTTEDSGANPITHPS